MEGSNTTHEGHLYPCLPRNSRLPKVTDETDATVCETQWCGSGSGIRDPGWVASQHPDLGSGIRDEPPGSYFLELRNHFLGLKYLNSFMRIRDPDSGIRDGDSSDPGSGMGKSRIRDGKKSDPGSGINIPDPQHWWKYNISKKWNHLQSLLMTKGLVGRRYTYKG